MGQLFLGNSPACCQVFPAIEVVLGLLHSDFLRRHLRFGTAHITEQAANLTHSAGQVGFGVLQTDQRIARIKVKQHLPFMNQIAIIGADAHHRPRHQRCDFDHIAVDIGVVGAFAPATIQLMPAPDTQADQDDQNGQTTQPEFTFTLITSILIVLRFIWCLHSSHDDYLNYSAREA